MLAFFFTPALRGEAMEWGFSYSWEGLWDDLRRFGVGRGRLFPQRARELTVRFVFPRGTVHPELRYRSPLVGTVTEHSLDGDPCLEWQITDVTANYYEFEIGATLPLMPTPIGR